ncbi:hypothetical protein ABZ027_07950 [Streptomyces sp. NPDC006332]|uniref:hypothetical protein n=1 Tax=Streptomyces sp. NPDC006332 TaxID=3155456 RepID=UPI00339FBB8F
MAVGVADRVVFEHWTGHGERFGYAELGFILLGEMVRRSTGRPLVEAADGLFARLGMGRSGFLPGPELDVAAPSSCPRRCAAYQCPTRPIDKQADKQAYSSSPYRERLASRARLVRAG